MSSIALDTNAYRALDDGDDGIVDQLRSVPSIGLPIIVIGELYAGFISGNRKDANIERLQRFLASPRVEVLHIDESTPSIFGHIAHSLRQAGRPIQQDDMWIAALCLQHGYDLATRDSDFRHVPLLSLRTF